jgi:GNAT superfamily N-acetyltransferase
VTDHDLIRRTCESIFGYRALGNERFEASGVTFVRNLATPRYPESNQVGLIRISDPKAIVTLIEASHAEFADLPYRHFLIDPLTPPEVHAHLALQPGYRAKQTLFVVVEVDLPAKSRDVEIREVVSETDWAVYEAMDKIWWLEYGGGVGPLQRWSRMRLAHLKTLLGSQAEAVHDEVVKAKRSKAPASRTWFACVNGVPAAFFSSWPGESGVGRVIDLYTHPDFRRRGLASALIRHCVAAAREGGAGPVTAGPELTSLAKDIYLAHGFRPLLVISDVYIDSRPAADLAHR